MALCLAGESVQVYEFDTAAQAQAAVALIDPDDPSHVGASIVEWVGQPAEAGVDTEEPHRGRWAVPSAVEDQSKSAISLW